MTVPLLIHVRRAERFGRVDYTVCALISDLHSSDAWTPCDMWTKGRRLVVTNRFPRLVTPVKKRGLTILTFPKRTSRHPSEVALRVA